MWCRWILSKTLWRKRKEKVSTVGRKKEGMEYMGWKSKVDCGEDMVYGWIKAYDIFLPFCTLGTDLLEITWVQIVEVKKTRTSCNKVPWRIA